MYRYIPDYLDPIEADELFAWLEANVSWRQERYLMFGRFALAPRLVAWYGNPGLSYSYSGITHKTTGWPTVVAFDCGNMPPVADALRKRFSKADFIIAADNDLKTSHNPGVTKATEAARLIDGRLAVPEIKDFNDLAVA